MKHQYEITIISNGNVFGWKVFADFITSNEVGCILFWYQQYNDSATLITQAPKEAFVTLLPDAD
jgi:hypothetical protein